LLKLEVSKVESTTATNATLTTNGVSSIIVNSEVHKEFDPLVTKFNDLDSSFKKGITYFSFVMNLMIF
jgi:hypothetical protein